MPDDRTDLDREWARFLAGKEPMLRFGRSLFRFLPSPPRCKLCHAPFRGPGAPLMRLIGKVPWERNPRMCRFCAKWLLKKGAGGAEVEVALVFADVRGSTGLAERMAPREYSALINRFFTVVTDALVRCDGVIDQLVGDEVIGLFLPGYAGPEYARRAVEASRMLLTATGHGDPAGPWLPIGVGVHSGVAYVGSVGSGETFTDFTALGDSVNTTARLASEAGAGEILITEATARQAGLEIPDAARRTLSVKGRTEPLSVCVLSGGTLPG